MAPAGAEVEPDKKLSFPQIWAGGEVGAADGESGPMHVRTVLVEDVLLATKETPEHPTVSEELAAIVSFAFTVAPLGCACKLVAARSATVPVAGDDGGSVHWALPAAAVFWPPLVATATCEKSESPTVAPRTDPTGAWGTKDPPAEPSPSTSKSSGVAVLTLGDTGPGRPADASIGSVGSTPEKAIVIIET